MSEGTISMRYAKALLMFSQEREDSDEVCRQVVAMEKALMKIPSMQQIMGDTMAVSGKQKLELLRASLGGKEMSETLERFLNLVIRNGRVRNLRFILHTYLRLYYKSRNIRYAVLTTAVAPPEDLEEKIRAIAIRLVGGEVRITRKVDPSLIGGFTFKISGYRFDASVKSQLKALKKEFTDKNKRIV